jgi:carbon-monoxide dehydrogenase medium subunit
VLQSTFGGLVAQAARKTAHHGLRNLAKLGAVVLEPAAAPELASALLSCDSQVAYFAGSEKTKPLSEYFSQAGEKGIPLAVTLDQEKGGQAQSSIQWLGRSPMDRAMIVVAASAQFEGEKINWLRLAAAADGYSPTRLIQVEEMLEGKALSSLSQDALTTALRQSVEPQESFRASAEYQKEMTALLGWRAIQDIAGKVGA